MHLSSLTQPLCCTPFLSRPVFGRPFPPRLATMMVLLTLGSGCVRHLPRESAPEPRAPQLDSSASIPAGHGRVIVDVEDHAPVTRVTLNAEPTRTTTATDSGGSETRERWTFEPVETVVCEATPCVLDVPIGHLMLSFPTRNRPGQLSTPELLYVGATPAVFRRTLDSYEEGTPGLVYTGVIGAILGVVGVIVGTTIIANDDGMGGNISSLAGGITVGAGVGLLALGILFAQYGAATLQPGSSVHFPL